MSERCHCGAMALPGEAVCYVHTQDYLSLPDGPRIAAAMTEAGQGRSGDGEQDAPDWFTLDPLLRTLQPKRYKPRGRPFVQGHSPSKPPKYPLESPGETNPRPMRKRDE